MVAQDNMSVSSSLQIVGLQETYIVLISKVNIISGKTNIELNSSTTIIRRDSRLISHENTTMNFV